MSTIRPADTEIAWLAGLLDGEASVGIARTKRGQLTASVQLSMTHETTVAHARNVMAILGVQGLHYTYRERKAWHRPAHQLNVARLVDVRALALAVLPHSVTKAEQWRLILAFTTSRLAGCDVESGGRVRRGGPGTSRRPYSLDEQELARQLRELNGRVAA